MTARYCAVVVVGTGVVVVAGGGAAWAGGGATARAAGAVRAWTAFSGQPTPGIGSTTGL